MTWGGGRYPFRSGDPVIGESGDRKTGPEARETYAELGSLGIGLYKPFGILDDDRGRVGKATAEGRLCHTILKPTPINTMMRQVHANLGWLGMVVAQVYAILG
jgi:hypothetical protein